MRGRKNARSRIEKYIRMKKNLSNNKNTGKYKNEITNVIDTMLDRLKRNEDVTEAIVDTASIISQGTYQLRNTLPKEMKGLLPEPEAIVKRLRIFEEQA